MKPYDYYSKMTVEYPSKANYSISYFYRRGKLVCERRPFSEIVDAPIDAVEEVLFDEECFKLHEKLFFDEKVALEEEFKRDLFEAEGVTNHEKADKCFSLAWDYGSSAGLREVHEYFKEIVQLIK
jgi:hypothetical protein